MKRLRSDGAVV